MTLRALSSQEAKIQHIPVEITAHPANVNINRWPTAYQRQWQMGIPSTIATLDDTLIALY